MPKCEVCGKELPEGIEVCAECAPLRIEEFKPPPRNVEKMIERFLNDLVPELEVTEENDNRKEFEGKAGRFHVKLKVDYVTGLATLMITEEMYLRK